MKLYAMAFSVFLGFFLALPAFCQEIDYNITAKEALKLAGKNKAETIFVDVRSPGEFAGGHLEQARNINFFGPRFEMEIEALPREAEIVVYCNSGKRSEAATEMLRETGHVNARNMIGGLAAWKKAGGKLVKDQPPK